MRRILLLAVLFISTTAPARAERTPASRGSIMCRPALSNEWGRACSGAEIAAWNEELFGNTEAVIATFTTAFARGFTVGVSDVAFCAIFDPDMPEMIAAQRRTNPHSSTAGTILGGAFLIVCVGRWLVRRLLRKAARPHPKTVPAAPIVDSDDEDEIAGSFVTRDGYEFIVMRGGRVLEVITEPQGANATAVDISTN